MRKLIYLNFIIAVLAVNLTVKANPVKGQRPGFNYDESKVPKYTLPELLKTADGRQITTSDEWEKIRRPEIQKLFENQVFGKSPDKPQGMTFEVKKSLHAISNKTSEASYVILEIPLLAKNSSYYSLIDRVLVVDCGEKSQIDRVMQRSQLTEIEIKKIINAQPSRQVRLALADDVIKNDTNAGNLVEKIGKLHQKYINTCIVSKTIS